MNVSEAIFQKIKDNGTDTVFFLPGGGAMYLVDALARSGLRAVACYHEQGAGYAALGYAITTGKLGVCLVTSGPGATNAITPCAAAWTDSVPVLFISGQARSDTLCNGVQRTRGQQEINITPMITAITKKAFPLDWADRNERIGVIDRMIAHCSRERPGPCWLDIPLDVQSEEI